MIQNLLYETKVTGVTKFLKAHVKIRSFFNGLLPRVCLTGVCWGGVPTPPPPPLSHSFEICRYLTKCIGKISWPNVVNKSGVFHHKKRNAEFYQYPIPQKSNFYWRWRFLKKLYKISTTIMIIMNILPWNTLDFLPTTSYDVCNVMFINEQKR